MKSFKNIFVFIFLLGLTSCNFDDVLTEVPKDFQGPENSFVNKAGFESALANIYLDIRTNLYAYADSWENFDMLGYDADFGVRQVGDNAYLEYFRWNTLNADNYTIKIWWEWLYSWVYQANVIIDRSESDLAKWTSDEEKNAIVGEAKFLRAFAYHFLANLWGGVPLVLTETTSPRFDYQRATQEAIYQQCKSDLEFAVQWMKNVGEVKGGRASRAAACHLLSEIYICLEDYDGAINAASEVIDNSDLHLMTERFGVYKDFTFNGYDYLGAYEPWGDVYWDLFREGNMNREDGNFEAIWNVEFDPTALGGGSDGGDYGGNFVLERQWGPAWWGINDIEGNWNWLKDTLGGRPISGITPTPYVTSDIWNFKGDWNKDIRNSKYNIQRTYYWTNPASPFFGQPMTVDNIGYSDKSMFIVPSFKKAVTCVHHGLSKDSESGQKHDNGRIFKDWYLMRLPETYLLRAEAYHRKGDNAHAANDINMIRNRAKATPVNPGEVDLDLILDERARELYMEEFRLNTLTRMGKLTEYLMKYNTVVIVNGYNLSDHLNKFPIPQSEIEANKEAELEQNPGY